MPESGSSSFRNTQITRQYGFLQVLVIRAVLQRSWMVRYLGNQRDAVVSFFFQNRFGIAKSRHPLCWASQSLPAFMFKSAFGLF
ncbi:MAG: hypothetical protein FWD67_08560 [Betaproteobacteria bacterium]|nr:hypothetical protein [Betaproteobacteria bacterium]